MKANVYKVHYEDGSQELVIADSEQMIAECCKGVNQISNVAEGVRVLERPEPTALSEEKQMDELLASVPSATSGESQ